jgi:SAM-dependent methyltransferase
MRNSDAWQPSKFELRRHRLRASRERSRLPRSSIVAVDTVAPHYATMIEQHARGHLLDLGAGLAPLHGVYRERVSAITCVDWAASLHQSPYIDVFANLDEPLPFADATFDTVLMTDVLEHLPRPHLVFDEIARLLTPGGKLLLGVPFLVWLHERPHDYGRYTEHMLRTWLTRANLSVLSLEATGGSPEVVGDMLARHASVLGVIGDWIGLSVSALLRLSPMRRLSRITSAWYPYGYVAVAERPRSA